MMVFGQEKHASDKISGRDSLSAFDLSVPFGCLDNVIGIDSVCSQRDIVSMNTKITLVFVESIERSDVRSVLYHFVHPLDAPNHFVPLLFVEDWRALVLADLFVRVDAYDQVVAERFRLSACVRMTKMDHVEASILIEKFF
jgi:hypothetical protein